MTATANYSSFFTDTAMMFGKKFELDLGNMERMIDEGFHKQIFEKMAGGEDYLRKTNLDSLLYSYTFLGNHDKPRALHCFAFDMQLFYADLTMYDSCKNGHEINEIQKQNPAYPKSLIDNYRVKAFRILNNRMFGEVKDYEVENYDFSRVSSKAIAMAETMMHGFGNAINDLPEEKRKATYEAIAQAISDLAKGKYLDKNFNADAFAVKPFDVTINAVISQAQLKYNLDLKSKEVDALENKALEIILEPAFTRLLGAMKILSALPGKPTLYSGDDLGETGYEEKTKNIYLQNRGYQHREWVHSKPLVRTFYTYINDIMAMRSRPELDALNNGTPYTLPIQKGHNGKLISGIFRQNTDGRMAVTLFNTHGMHHDIRSNYSAEHVYLDCIDLNEYYTRADGKVEDKVGLKGGIKPGTIFRNAINPQEEFEVFVHDDGGYHIHHRDGSPICISDTTMILYHDPEEGQRNLANSGKSKYNVPATVVSESYKTISLI